MKRQGLSSGEADQLLQKHGPNELTSTHKTTPLQMFISQFNSPLVLILLFAAVASVALGDFFEGALILVIVVLNALLGFVQENKAEKALAALKHMTVSVTRVYRDGTLREIDSKLLVPGDVILLEEGDKVPADAELIESMHFEVNESALTGESLPVEKDAQAEDKRLIFLGTVAAKGRATARVTATGMATRFGSIAHGLSTIEKEDTPLVKKLAVVSKQIGLVALGAVIIIFLIGLAHGDPIIELFLTGISLAVAAVPEGLPAVITITLALGTQRMARQKAILRKLAAIEALGGITIIATDKTGTLTRNEMRVTKLWMDYTEYKAHDKAISVQDPIFQDIIQVSVLCNNASLAPVKDHGSFDVVGDKTEGALLLMAADHNINIDAIKRSGQLVEEFAFDATTKTMSVFWKNNDDGTYILTKGAPESILARSTRILTSKGEKALDDKEKERIIAAFEQCAKEGLRLIALAHRKESWNRQSRTAAESQLTFLGFVGISDPARAEVPAAIAMAERAGIRTIMITGDNELTAYTIAQNIGLIKQGEEVITGMQFASLSDTQAIEKLGRIRVFARTTPEQKLHIVRLLQKMGHVVAVTGDGVNDALALKQADVGVAMGKTGTDVAKEAAEMIVTDDNYATIVAAVEEGRAIFDNMKASIKYLIGCNIGEIIAILGGALLGWPFILTPIQILYMNLATDGLQAIALAVNPKHHAIMKRKPRTETGLFNRYDVRWFAEVCLLTALATLFAFSFGWRMGDVTLGRTLAFTIIILAQQYIYLDIAATDRSIFTLRITKNKWLLLPIVVLLVQLGYLYIPGLQGIFKLTAPRADILIDTALVTTIMVVVSELRKRFARRWYYPPS